MNDAEAQKEAESDIEFGEQTGAICPRLWMSTIDDRIDYEYRAAFGVSPTAQGLERRRFVRDDDEI